MHEINFLFVCWYWSDISVIFGLLIFALCKFLGIQIIAVIMPKNF
jgi:hypothetical protein